MHQLAGFGGGLEVMAILSSFVDVDLPISAYITKIDGLPQTERTTGVSNSYNAFHLSWLGAITLISVNSKGLRSQTFDMTSFASVQRPQLGRVKKVRRRTHCCCRKNSVGLILMVFGVDVLVVV